MQPKQMGNSRRGPDDLDRAQRQTGIEDDRELQDERFAGSDEDNEQSMSASSGTQRVLREGEEIGPWSDEDAEDEDELAAGSGSDEEDEGIEAGASPSSPRSRSRYRPDDEDGDL